MSHERSFACLCPDAVSECSEREHFYTSYETTFSGPQYRPMDVGSLVGTESGSPTHVEAEIGDESGEHHPLVEVYVGE